MEQTKIFGVGLNKTGTTSLKQAFTELGFKHFARKPRLLRLWNNGKFDDIYKAIEGYDSFEDWPWPLMVPELLQRYGRDARFILTRRLTPEIWVESLVKHAARTNPHNNPRRIVYGYANPAGHEADHIDFYVRHLARTRAFLEKHAPDQFIEICFEEGDGWEEICGFLGRVVPEKPFPHANQSRATDFAPPPPVVTPAKRRSWFSARR